MTALSIVRQDTDNPMISGRELHERLEIETPYHKWFPRMCEYGFAENQDYFTEDKIVHRADGTVMPQTQHDHQLTIDMAKEICMLQPPASKSIHARLCTVRISRLNKKCPDQGT